MRDVCIVTWSILLWSVMYALGNYFVDVGFKLGKLVLGLGLGGG